MSPTAPKNATTDETTAAAAEPATDVVAGVGESTAPVADAVAEAPVVDDEPTEGKQTCAFCGETAVFTGHTDVGGHTQVDFHGCPASSDAVHAFFVASAHDASVKPPAFVAE